MGEKDRSTASNLSILWHEHVRNIFFSMSKEQILMVDKFKTVLSTINDDVL